MLAEQNINTIENEKSEKINLFVLTMMYTGFWTLLLDSTIISEAILTLYQVMTLFLGIYHFSFIIFKDMKPEFDGVYMRKPLTNTGLFALIVWLGFGLSVILSELIHTESPHVGFMYFIYIPIFFFYIIPKSLQKPIKTTVKSLLFSGLVILILSFLWKIPATGVAYSGITNNSNSMGMVANQTVLSSLCLFYMEFQRRRSNKVTIALYLFFSVIGMLFLIVSESRTSLLVAIIGMFIIFVHGLIRKHIKISHLLILLVFFLIVYQFFLRDYFVEGILEKFITFTSSSNILAGRTDIWKNIIMDSTLFGYGFEYFSNHLEIQAHNDVFQFIGMNGLIAGILLAVFFGITIILSIRYAMNNRKKTNAIIPMVFVVGFIALGMAETVLGFNAKTPSMVYYNFVGIMLLDL